MPVALISSFRSETDKKLRGLYTIAYVSVFIECLGTLFKIQHWPGAGLLMIVGIPVPFVLFLPAYIFQIRKNKQLNYNNLLLVLFFFAYFASITALLSLNISRNVIEEMVLSANSYEEQSQLTNSQTLALIASLPSKSTKDDANRQLALKINSKATSICDIIDRMKAGIVRNVDNSNEELIKDGHINLWEVNGKDNRTMFYREIFKTKALELKGSLAEYKELLISAINNDKEVTDFINHQLDITEDWQFRKFDGKYLVAMVETLSAIKKSVELSAFEAVSAL